MTTTTLSKGEKTRTRLLDLAEDAVLHKGFAGTSIDELIAAANITKSGFFYHFKDKNDLAKALLLRFLEQDDIIFNELLQRADNLNEDPLHSFLIFLKLLAETMDNMEADYPGCLVASYCYQDRLFSEEVRQLTAEGVLGWRTRFNKRLTAIAEKYPPRADVNLKDVADMLSAIVDGGIILSKALRKREHLSRQIDQYRTYIRLLFATGQ